MSQDRNFFWGNILCFRKCLVRKQITNNRGLSSFCVGNFFSHSTEIFVGETFNVSEGSGYRETLCMMGGGGGRGNHDFAWQIFGLAVLENFTGEPLCVSENDGSGKNL